ncbi:MAG: transcriptional regulator [Chloroflexi bacterium]|nr:transcriptional regulator [Chloroflexota bacterium]
MPPPISYPPSAGDILAALARGADGRTALLKAKISTRKINESLVALANAQGGLAIIGADSKAIGLAQPEQTQSQAATAALLSDPPLILPEPSLIDADGQTFCVMQVPAGLPRVYSLKGQYFVRDGQHNRPMLPEELRRLLIDRNEVGFETQLVEGATVDHLDRGRIQAFVDQLDGVLDESEDDLLSGRGCLAQDRNGLAPTVAGVLLFASEPQRWLRSAEITCVRYAGTTMSDDFVREDVRGVLADQIKRSEAFVSTNMRRGMRIRGLAREDTPEYPISIVREAIVNAVAHRDYSIRGDNIRVLMFGDRLEVYSPGRLPGHVTVENIVDERFSRNEAIVQVLSEIGFIERLGYGIDRMISVCESEELPKPRFAETAAGFKVTIYGHGPELIGAPPPRGLYSHLRLNARQELALAFLQTNRRITNRDYQGLCADTSPETLRRDFADMVDRGILLKIGEKRATYYVLK